jgi:CBS domain-containing protein
MRFAFLEPMQPKRTARSTVGELMSRKVTTVGTAMSAPMAMQIMLASGVRHLPVIDDGKLVGILSDRDFLTWSDDVKLSDLSVREVMTEEPETTTEEEDVPTAAGRMAAQRIDCLPVVDAESQVVGILTSSDIVAERGRLLFKGGKGEVPSVATLMVRDPIYVSPSDALVGAVVRMVQEGIRHMVVADENRRVVGVLSDRDLRLLVGDEQLKEMGKEVEDLAVEWAMTPNPFVIAQDAGVFELASYFIDERVGAVPVVDGEERLVGIVSYVDLLGYLMGRNR